MNINDIQHVKKRRFLKAYAEEGSITAAAKRVKIDRTSHYHWMNADDEKEREAYRAAFEYCHNIAADLLEEEARRRAVEGVETDIISRVTGERLGTETKYSDTLLIFLLKGNKPEKFKERSELSGPGGTPLRLSWDDGDEEETDDD